MYGTGSVRLRDSALSGGLRFEIFYRGDEGTQSDFH
jgi:hypothetical protein